MGKKHVETTIRSSVSKSTIYQSYFNLICQYFDIVLVHLMVPGSDLHPVIHKGGRWKRKLIWDWCLSTNRWQENIRFAKRCRFQGFESLPVEKGWRWGKLEQFVIGFLIRAGREARVEYVILFWLYSSQNYFVFCSNCIIISINRDVQVEY